METFSLFPDLLDLYPFAGLLLRVTAGYLYTAGGVRVLRHLSTTRLAPNYAHLSTLLHAHLSILVGVACIIGIWVQAAAIVGVLLILYTPPNHDTVCCTETRTLLTVVCLSLLFLGAGPFAIDLPL